MKVIRLDVSEEYVQGAGIVVGAEGSADSTKIQVYFSDDWAELSKYATTRNSRGESETVTVLTAEKLIEGELNAYEFTVPATAMAYEGLMSLTFTGYEVENGNELSTVTNTATALLRVLPSDWTTASDSSMTPTIAQQLQAEIDTILEDITDARAAATEAETSATNAATSETNASASATLAESYAKGGTSSRSGEDTDNSDYYHKLAMSYAKGGSGVRTGEDEDNAKYYMEQTEAIAGTYVVEDNLESTETGHALSANQGRVLDGKITAINNARGAANGFASLDANGKLPTSELTIDAMEYKGTWNASTNTPTIADGTGNKGDFYIVSTGGTWNNITFSTNDRVIYDGSNWQRLSGGEVLSVCGKTGAVLLGADDISFDNTGSGIVADDVEGAIKEVFLNAGAQVQEVTMSYYIAHKAELDASGDLIVITDSGLANTASNVTYDNTNSGLVAENVQGAIDEVNDKVGAFLYKNTQTITVTLDANKTYIGTVAPTSIPGYTPIGIVGHTISAWADTNIFNCMISGGDIVLGLSAPNESIGASEDVYLDVLYVKS